MLYANLQVLIVKPPKDYKQEEWYQMLGLSRLCYAVGLGEQIGDVFCVFCVLRSFGELYFIWFIVIGCRMMLYVTLSF